MTESLSLLKRAFSYGTVSALTVIAMFLFHIMAGRFLGVVDYGRFSFALTFVFMLAPMLDPGIYYLIIREIAKDHSSAKKYLSHALTWIVICAPVFLLVVFIGAGLINDSELTLRVVGLMAIAKILQSAKYAMRPTLLGLEKFNLDAVSLVVERFGLLIICSLVLFFNGDLISFCWAYVIVRLGDLLITSAIVAPSVSIRLGLDFAFLRSMLRAALPIGAFYITLNVYNYVDVVMLSALRGDDEVGWYSAAYKLYEGPIMIPSIIGTIFMPRMSRLFAENRSRFINVLKRGAEWVAGAAVLVTIVGIVFAQMLIVVSFGEEFKNSVIALKILLLGSLFVFTINFLQTVLISIERQRVVLLIAIGGLAGNVALNLLLIPIYGYVGASFATIIIEGVAFTILVRFVWKTISSPKFLATNSST